MTDLCERTFDQRLVQRAAQGREGQDNTVELGLRVALQNDLELAHQTLDDIARDDERCLPNTQSRLDAKMLVQPLGEFPADL